MHIELALFSIGRRWSFRNYSIQSLFGFFSLQTLESKFMEFSFAEKHLFPSVPMFITGSCFLGGAITTLLCWKFFSKWGRHPIMHYGTCNGKPMNCFGDSTDHFTDTAAIWNSVVLKRIFWDVRRQMRTSCGYKFGFKILKLVSF